MSILRGVTWWFLLALAGCLEVESMEARVVADRANDRLDVMITSRGLWSSAQNEQNLKKDLADLLACRERAAVPFPGIGVIDFGRQDGGKDAAWTTVLPFLDIEAGAFFTDEQGRLSFYQFLRIHRPQQFAAEVGRLTRESWAQQPQRGSPATLELLARAALAQMPVLVIDGAGFTFRRPLGDDDHRAEQERLWREVARGVERAVQGEDGAEKSDATQRGMLQTLRENDVAVVRRVGLTEYVVGTQGSDVCDYQIRGGRYQDDLRKAFTADEPPPPAVTQALIDRQFAAFHRREARLPPEFAEQKRKAAAGTGGGQPR